MRDDAPPKILGRVVKKLMGSVKGFKKPTRLVKKEVAGFNNIWENTRKSTDPKVKIKIGRCLAPDQGDDEHSGDKIDGFVAEPADTGKMINFHGHADVIVTDKIQITEGSTKEQTRLMVLGLAVIR